MARNTTPAVSSRMIQVIPSLTAKLTGSSSTAPRCASNQMRLIQEGHYLLPWFSHPVGEVPDDPEDFQIRYYKDAIAKARELNLPLTFIASQWESGLSGKPYTELPAEENPNLVTVDGEIEDKIDWGRHDKKKNVEMTALVVGDPATAKATLYLGDRKGEDITLSWDICTPNS